MLNPYTQYRQFKLENLTAKRKNTIWFKIVLPLIGLLALIWFLIRVIPKPSRATYPCQKIAFPLASSFIIWLIGICGVFSFLKRAQKHLNNRKTLLSLACFVASILIFWTCLTMTSQKQALAADPIPNQPIGDAKGIFPGRVVWVHDPNATDWEGAGDGYSWQSENTPQKYVDAMISKAIRELSGCQTDGQAWDAIFKHFNTDHEKGDVGYTPGEKITIKVNLTTCNASYDWVDPNSHEKTTYLDRSDTNPQMILSVLRQLVYTVGVEPNSIAVGDTLARFPNQWRDLLYPEFPEVIYFDKIGGSGRTQSTPSGIVQHWSHGLDPNNFKSDCIPSLYAEADYLINMPVLKSHGAGITLSAKNHYGSYNRRPDDEGYYDLHPSLGGNNTDPGQYRALVDIIGHPHMGGKTLLYMIDGLYGGDNWDGYPYRFLMDPFNNDWPSSILVSQDPVAIDSVGLDILWTEGWSRVRDNGGLDDYLVEAALADNPPSDTFYDPDGDSEQLASLGVHERWNDPNDRQYSRNLGTGDGIELQYIKLKHYPGDLNSDDYVGVDDLLQLTEQWLWTGDSGAILEDLIEDGIVNLNDFATIAENWGSSF
jgi:hypothetical protein